MRRRIRLAAAGVLILAGLVMAAYPWISNILLERQVDSQVNSWKQAMDAKEADGTLEQMRREAERYNEQLVSSHVQLTDPFVDTAEDEANLRYEQTLANEPSDPICFLEIPALDLYLPVFHGTSAEVLEKGIGHLEGSALPIGGEGNHSILSGHTGLNTAKLFTDLVLMKEGDYFLVHVLGEELIYRVCRILVIEPEDTSGLIPAEDRDLVSLLTCTPYGVNTHRLVVTGERVPAEEWESSLCEILGSEEEEGEREESLWLRSYRRALVIGCLIVGVITCTAAVWQRRNRWKKK